MFELVFERFLFRATEIAALGPEAERGSTGAGCSRRQAPRRGAASEDASRAGHEWLLDDELSPEERSTRCGEASPPRCRRRPRGGDGADAAHARPRAARDRCLRAPPGGLGRDRRRRSARAPRARPARRAASGARAGRSPPRRGTTRRRCGASKRCCAGSSKRCRSGAPGSFRPHGRCASSTARCPRARCRISPPCTAWSRSCAGGSPRRAARARGHARHAHVDVRRTMRASLQTGGVPVVLKYRPQRPRRPEIYVLCDVSTSRDLGLGLLPLRAARAARLVSQDALVRVHRAHQRGHADLRSASATSRALSDQIARRAGVADVSGYTDYGRVWSELLELVEDDLHPRATVIVLGDARTNGRDPRAAGLRRDLGARRAHLLAESRAAPVLELRRLSDGRVRALLPCIRVLDDARSSRTSCGRSRSPSWR